MAEITIRNAALADLEILLSFEREIVKAERPFDITIQDGDIHYYDIAEMIKATDVEVLVATFGTEIIGSGYARIESSKIYLKHRKHAYLGFMYTRPAFRGKGVNKKIIEALKAWSIAQNVTEMRLEVYNDNQTAIKAYEKVGFAKLMIEMRMAISDDLTKR